MTILRASAFVLGLGLSASAATAQQADLVMSGLDNPRGLALGPDGGIYVAEAGRGGGGTEIVGGEGVPVQYGATGAVSRYLGGAQQRVVTALPSLAPQGGATPGGRATGLHDIAFRGGDLYGVVGLGGDPAKRAALAGDSGSFAHLVRLPLGGAPQNVADLGAHEAAQNPDGALPDTNPYNLIATAAGFTVADAGANAVLDVTAAGVVSTRAVLPARPNPLPFGPPTFQAVPTAVAAGPDGVLRVGQLTGFPFPPGAANVYRLDPATGAPTVEATGFTNVIDLAFGPDGDLFVLQLTSNGLAAAQPGPGRLVRIDAETGTRTTVLEDPLFFPGGLLITPDYSIYVSNLGVSAGGGEVLRIVPEPGAGGAIAVGLSALRLLLRRRRRRAVR